MAIPIETVDLTGKTDNSIGEIIIEVISDNENLAYVEGVWDVTETDLYLALCADIGFYFSHYKVFNLPASAVVCFRKWHTRLNAFYV